jgi:hypothetical protein
MLFLSCKANAPGYSAKGARPASPVTVTFRRCVSSPPPPPNRFLVGWLVDGAASLIAMMIDAMQTSETLVNSYQYIRRYNPEDSHLQKPEISPAIKKVHSQGVKNYWKVQSLKFYLRPKLFMLGSHFLTC